MHKFALLAMVIFMASTVRADKSCSLCGLLFDNKSELIAHIIQDHPIRDAGSSPKSDNQDINLGLVAIIIYDYINRPVSFIVDKPRYKQVWEEINFNLELNFKNQTMMIARDMYHKENYCDCGSALLLMALHMRSYSAIKILLEKPEDLAYLDVVDAKGKNALKKAEEVASSYLYGSEEYELWQEIVFRLESLYRFARFKSPERKAQACIPDFYWPIPKKIQMIEDIGWRLRNEKEAEDFIDPTRLNQAEWWGHCHASIRKPS